MYPYELRGVVRNNIYDRGYICGNTLAFVEYKTIQKNWTMYEEAYCSYGARTNFFCENKVAGKLTDENGKIMKKGVFLCNHDQTFVYDKNDNEDFAYIMLEENKFIIEKSDEDRKLLYRDVWDYWDESEDEEGYSFSRNDSKQSSDDSNESESESSSNSRGSEHNLENNDGELIASDPDNLTHLS